MWSERTTRADHPLLRDGGDEPPVTGVEPPEAETAAVGDRRGLLRIEQPFISTSGCVEPHGVIETGRHQPLGAPRESEHTQHRLEDGVVADIGDRQLVGARVVVCLLYTS